MKKKLIEKYEEIVNNFYNNVDFDEMLINEHNPMCYRCPELFEAYSTVLNEKLSGDIVDKEFSDDGGFFGGLYKGKKFPAGFTTSNFGKQIENKDELEINKKYNIFVESLDSWIMGFRLKPNGIGQYKFKLDNTTETESFNIKRLYNNIKKGYIISYSD